MTMLRVWRGSVATGIVAMTAGAAGCAVFTDLNVDPYALADASNDGRASDSGGCDAGTCPKLLFDCHSSAECDDGGVCCLSSLSSSAAAFTCQPKTCSLSPSLQLCKTSAECGGSSCIQQGCPANGVAVQIGACSPLPGCSAL